MKIKTRVFGEIEITKEKIITFERGIIGFPELKNFILLHDKEKGLDAIHFLQSIEEPYFAIPVINPLIIKDDYAPQVKEELLSSIGNVTDDNLLVMVTITIPSDLIKMSVNLQGPIIINTEEQKGCQVILENHNYSVKFPIYEILQKRRAGE